MVENPLQSEKAYMCFKTRGASSRDYTVIGLIVSLISDFFSNKISRANKWMRKKIPTHSNSALYKSVYSEARWEKAG